MLFKKNSDMHVNHRGSGFSLVELSIVLVILGLLTGGILGGQALIRAAELRAVTKEYEQWVTAAHAFRTKYFAVPGDMLNATRFWGRADNGTFSGQCADPLTNTGTGTQTCNGNGDGYVNLNGMLPNETFRFWQHLANAGLIPGQYSGVAGPGSFLHHIRDENYPDSKTGGAGWFPAAWVDYPGSASVFAGDFGNYLHIGTPIADQHPYNAYAKPEEAWSIDTKIDDGKPATGKVRAQALIWCVDTSDANDMDADYRLDDDRILCANFFTHAF